MRAWMTAGLAILATSFLVAACGGGEEPAPSSRSKATPPPPIARKAVPPGFEISAKPEGFDMSDAEVIAKGRELFLSANGPNCASCHGMEGKGDGPLSNVLPKPTDLTSPEFQTSDKVTDEYIYWRIKTGNEGYVRTGPNVSAMTGYMDGTPEEVWSLVAFVRSLAGE